MIAPDPSINDDLPALVARTEGLQPWRRVFHAANGVALAYAPVALGVGRGTLALILGVVFLGLAGGDLFRLANPRANALFFRAFPSLASPREASGIASSTWYALGALLTWLLFPASATPALLVLALADPTASVVGRGLRGRRFGKGTIPGSAAFFCVAFTVLLFAAPPIPAAVVAAGAALVEVMPLEVDDNLSVPISVGLLLLLIG